MNDNRTQILAQQAIEDANNSSYQQQQMEQHQEMILAQQQNIRRLKAELVDMTMQRDAWFKMVCAYGLGFELTAEEADMLSRAIPPIDAPGSYLVKLDNLGDSHMKFMRRLSDMGLIEWHMKGLYWAITPAGRAALAAHKARCESEGE